jgi:acyl-CoA thioesterase II
MNICELGFCLDRSKVTRNIEGELFKITYKAPPLYVNQSCMLTRVLAMDDTVQKLMELLSLTPLDEGLYQGSSEDLGFHNVFGGQVIGQALMAAFQTVETTQSANSLHAYFLKPGDPDHDIIYDVININDGRTFCARRVNARQHGKEILTMTASFQRFEAGFDHQIDGPSVCGPEGLDSEAELRRKFADLIPEKVRVQLTCDRPIEIRPVNPVNPLAPEKKPPNKYNWLRAVRRVPDEVRWQQCMLAYSSDFGLLGASLYPHGVTFFQRNIQAASLDHAMWFHRPFDISEWLLYAMDSPSASHSRGLSRGLIYDQRGRLVASTAQEGLIRQRPDRR